LPSEQASDFAPLRAATWIRRLQLSNFRNYRALTIDLDHRPVVLAGDNGTGKTNLLEAVSMLAPGRGLRRAHLASLTHRSAPGADAPAPAAGALAESAGGSVLPGLAWAVSALVRVRGDEVRLGTALEPGPTARYRRHARIDRAPAPLNALAGIVSLVWLTPQMDRLFQEGPGARRRFIDRLTLAHDPGHGARVSAYERALRERQKLLSDPYADKGWLDALELQMAEHGIAVAAARAGIVEGLCAECEINRIEGFPSPVLTLSGSLEELLNQYSALEAEERYIDQLKAMRFRDAQSGRTQFGPHTSDLVVWNADKSMAARECSTGEQKALLISIILASVRLVLARRPNEAPLVLLDEIIAHLDGARREILLNCLCDLKCQVWMTGTDKELFAPLADRAQILAVANGGVWAC